MPTAHVEKYISGATGHMFAHYDRKRPGAESNIDETRTHLNYNLAEKDQPLSQQEFLKKRLSEIKVMKRADVNVMCDWIVTAPENLKPEEHEKFFLEVYAFLNNRYGKENVISAYVHMDETTPHVHYAFVPVVTDKKKGHLKLSAKEKITKGDLKTFHTDLTKRMTAVFGRDIGILNGATVNGSLTPKQMKKIEQDFENFQAIPVEEVTFKVARFIGNENVVVKRSELERINEISEEAQFVLRNQKAMNTKSAEIKKSAEQKFDENEKRSAELNTAFEDVANREKSVSEREEKVADIEIREKACEEKERELEQRTDSPDSFYRSQIKGLEETIEQKDEKLAEYSNLENQYEADLSYELQRYDDLERENKKLKQQLSDKDRETETRIAEKEKEVEAKFQKLINSKNETIANLNSTINGLKEKVRKAFRAVYDICVAVAALAYGCNGEIDKYVADLTIEQKRLVDAILNFGAKSSREEGFEDNAEKIETTRGLNKSIQDEYDRLTPKPVQTHSIGKGR